MDQDFTDLKIVYDIYTFHTEDESNPLRTIYISLINEKQRLSFYFLIANKTPVITSLILSSTSFIVFSSLQLL